MKDKSDRLQSMLNKAVDNNKVFGASFCLHYEGNTWCGSAGNMAADSRFFIASTTKLYITAIVLHLKSAGLLDLEDKIEKYLGGQTMRGLHVYRKTEYSNQISIRNLLAHTSGIPDYFQQGGKESVYRAITQGLDRSWSPDEAIAMSKRIKPRFVPDAPGKAHYSDTNFQLLHKVIEKVTDRSLEENLESIIFEPAGLRNTYVYGDPKDRQPMHLYFRNKPLHIPQAMASFGADGGMVSTARDMLEFVQAFFQGAFFPGSYLEMLKVWNRIFFPMQAGIGIHRFKLPRIFDPFGATPELIGHSGLSGALAFYSPEHNLYIAGTVNQLASPGTSFRLAIKLIREVVRS